MISYLRRISSKIANRLLWSYLIAFSVGTVLFLIMMGLNGWDLSAFLTGSFLLGLATISVTIMKFLGGVGMIITYAMVCAIAMKLFSSRIKGNKKAANRLKLVLMLAGFVFIGYGIYILITTFIGTPEVSILDILLSIYGIISLILFVYLIPLMKAEYKPTAEKSLWQRFKGKLGGFKYSLWKGYQSRIRKDYGKVYAAEYEHYKTDIEDIRDQLSGILLLPIIIIFVVFPPLFCIGIILWFRIFSQDQKLFNIAERIILILLITATLILGVIFFIFITEFLIILNVAYALGLFTSVVIYMYVLIKA